jgi:hypothetical protein
MIGLAAAAAARELRSRSVEQIIGIALVIIAAVEIIWITRTVQANAPR